MRTRVLSCLFAPLFPLLVTACPLAPSPTAKLQEAAQETNINTRFGRMEMAVDYIAPKERDEWAKRHKWWGGKIRIADAEMAGTHLTSDSEAEVTVRVAWYRQDEQELRTTGIRQKWRDLNGQWKLVGEAWLDGDVGLLGEPVVFETPAVERPAAQFPTVRLGGSP